MTMADKLIPLSTSRLAVIDIGSNSVRFVLYHICGVSFSPVHNEKVLAGLGRELNITGCLSTTGKEQAFAALKRFKILVDQAQDKDTGPIKTVIAATAALRDAKDAPEFIAKVREQIGFDISPMSGQQEALISALGVLSGDARARGIIADLGGASLELINLEQAKSSEHTTSKRGVSFKLGPFSMYQGAFIPDDLRPKAEAILQSLSTAPNTPFARGQDLYLIGGAWRNLFLIDQKRNQYPLKIASHYTLDADQALELANWAYSPDGQEILLNWNGLSPSRADTLPYSGIILSILIAILKPKSVIIAPGGLREGMVYHELDEQIRQRPALFDGCTALAQTQYSKDHTGAALYQFLEPLCQYIPHTFERDNENRLRLAACILSGIGKGLHPDHKAKLVFRSVLYAPLPALNHKERTYLALMLFGAYTSKPTTPNEETIQYFLSEREQKSARLYGQALRASMELSARDANILQTLSMIVTQKQLRLLPTEIARTLLTKKTQERLAKITQAVGINWTP